MGFSNVISGRVIAMGVNRVVSGQCSSAHAEVMALSLAQKALASWDLGGTDMKDHQLVVNWKPCTMCYGATLWSGIRSLVIAGDDAEMERITGFDEGPEHPRWREELNARGVELISGVHRDEALSVFHLFRDAGRMVYNGRQN